MRQIGLAFLLPLLLAACGTTGPLYLPATPAAAPAAPAAAQPAAPSAQTP